MAEYWKSAPKYWCKQCKIFIRDTPFEKAQHEATGKHQGNLKRFLRDIHRNNEQQQRESQRAKSEVERLRQTVAGLNDPSKGGDAAGAPWRQRETPKPQERPVSMEERKRQMAQLAEMGVAIPDEFRGEMALAGTWQTVSEKVIDSGEEGGSTAGRSVGVRKRKLEGGNGGAGDADVDEEEAEAKREAERFVSKGWGSSVRRYPGAKENDTDLDALLASTREIKRVKPSDVKAEADVDANPRTQQDAAHAGKQSTKGHFVPVKSEGEVQPAESDEAPAVKEEQAGDDTSLETVPKTEAEEPAAGVVFKKRKPKVMRK
ncbi:hypothetical protein ASPACDRAFT_48318 [Aspergillus aculeatus ATCC 16872]|uniref:U1-type domain-containing protein n=1 Tax=Aspergillus aculeatus (strain ATCC 16872 / CBS 172.66 / WB 5094) TaxID=690307 RepID=A0A1L9WFC2_ASPA1|nr:uncharacterized protein ASPACDRAFT_48318 [Aspergillus aculeatus ATCC 16872]OJJ94869.1 hypothetical protein ASPACDRAFT_48318 [Aspergillus aculeatus ATCC 16872]